MQGRRAGPQGRAAEQGRRAGPQGRAAEQGRRAGPQSRAAGRRRAGPPDGRWGVRGGPSVQLVSAIQRYTLAAQCSVASSVSPTRLEFLRRLELRVSHTPPAGEGTPVHISQASPHISRRRGESGGGGAGFVPRLGTPVTRPLAIQLHDRTGVECIGDDNMQTEIDVTRPSLPPATCPTRAPWPARLPDPPALAGPACTGTPAAAQNCQERSAVRARGGGLRGRAWKGTPTAA